jgi:capsular polysaccharide biosynthesis protein
MKNETKPADQNADQMIESTEEYISFAQIARMILKHRRKIAVCTILFTAIAAAFFLLSPRQYKAEGFLRVIPPVATIDEKVDRDWFETIIISHLQMVQSSFIAEEVAAALGSNAKTSAADIQNRMKIVRPLKSNLIALTATFPAPDQAVAIVRLWIQEYLASVRANNINVALCQVRSVLKKAQAGLMEMKAKNDVLKMRVEQTKPLVELARGINDNQLWREVAENAPADKVNKLSNIHITGQEQNEEYLALKTMFFAADQTLAAAAANCAFFQEVETYLEYKARVLQNHATVQPAQISSNAVQFAETMLKATDVIEVGTPALKSSSRGVARKTAIVFFISLMAAALCAYLCEWFKSAHLETP